MILVLPFERLSILTRYGCLLPGVIATNRKRRAL